MDKASTSSECDDETSMQQLLPSIKDPKLWLVKCKNGCERKLAVCMMRKFLSKGAEMKICSVTALDHLQNYIYIEADKLADVEEACRGISEIYPKHIKPVPIEEMAETISVKVKAGFSQDAWVRMKSGIYKGTLQKLWMWIMNAKVLQ
ncbi:putative transcription elongation factor SPT5 homolog 1 isoform X2 [Cornus florida]|uniref:putative transcription elongation factor SPT5 homolog 1 isoform X2 n=1 Tax=Cornus florida TaxID=4283 RepID=UPI0028A18064|nr:putative transcription elongation factor SPT5 homolog 1 isoform X2 [Cornus florida]XP_059630927.1 putative transcription elongation factor SPT5 homolog 1 isoform X2 [Cornus florida]